MGNWLFDAQQRRSRGGRVSRGCDLVERERERKAWAEAVLDRRRSLVVLGAPGVGKSAAAGLVVEEANRRRWDVECTACPSTPSPLAPFLHLIPGPDAGLDAGERLAVVMASIRERSAGQELLVLVDDIHDMDPLSAALVHQLVIHDLAVVLLTAREGLAFPPDIARLVRDGLISRAVLGPLSHRGSDKLIRLLLDAPVSRELFDEIWRLTRGNPLFIHEVLRSAREQGALEVGASGEWQRVGSTPLPSTVVGIVADRLERLDPLALTAACALAAAEPLRLSALERVASARAVADLERALLVEVGGSGLEPTVRFAHPLFGEAVRQTAPAGLLREAMQGVARELRAEPRADSRSIVLTALLEFESGHADAELLLSAAQRLLEGGDVDHAVELVSVPAARCDARADVVLAGADWLSGNVEAASRRFQDLLARCGDAEAVPVAFEYARYLLQREGDARSASDVLRSQLDRVDEASRPPLMAMLSLTEFFDGRPRGAVEIALPVIDTTGDPMVKAVAICGAVSGLAMLGRTSEGRALQRQIPDLIAQTGTATPGYVLLNSALMHVALDWQDGKIAATDGLYATRVEVEHLPYMTTDLMRFWITGIRMALIGRLDSAGSLHDRSTADTSRFGRHVTAFHAIMWSLVEAQRGHASRAHELLEAAESLPADRRMGFRWWGERSRAWYHAASGSTSRAVGLSSDLAAEFADQPLLRAVSLHDLVRFGRADLAVRDSVDLSHRLAPSWIEVVYADHARAAVGGDPEELVGVARHLQAGGLLLESCEALAEALRAGGWTNPADQAVASDALRRGLQTCSDPKTPALAETHPALTERERAVAAAAARGESNKVIAQRLGLSVRTVENHLQRTYDKLGVHDRIGLQEALGTSRLSRE